MTASTGTRAEQRLHEELFWGEIRLRRVLHHLKDAAAWARCAGNEREYIARLDAQRLATALLEQIEAQRHDSLEATA